MSLFGVLLTVFLACFDGVTLGFVIYADNVFTYKNSE